MLQINTTFLHLSFTYYIRCIKLLCYCDRYDKPNDLIIQLENVAYSICGDNPVTFPKFQQIFSTKEVSVIVRLLGHRSMYMHTLQIVDKLFRRIDEENLGYVTSFQIMEFLSTISNTR